MNLKRFNNHSSGRWGLRIERHMITIQNGDVAARSDIKGDISVIGKNLGAFVSHRDELS